MSAVLRLAELPAETAARSAREAEVIFWESAATQDFASEAERSVYRALWFGRYLDHAADVFFVALGPRGTLEGYLAASPVSLAPPLAGPDYYRLFPAKLLRQYPAHLHVNVRSESRGRGIGAALVDAFAGHCAALGLPGLHAITQANTRAADFFARCALQAMARADWNGRPLVFMGQLIDASSQPPVPARLRIPPSPARGEG